MEIKETLNCFVDGHHVGVIIILHNTGSVLTLFLIYFKLLSYVFRSYTEPIVRIQIKTVCKR